MTTRRRLLAGIGTLTAVAGCTTLQETSTPQIICDTGIGGEGGDLVFAESPHVSTYGTDDSPIVELVVPIRQATIESETVDQLTIFNGDETLTQIPVSETDDPIGESNRYDTTDVVEYSQSLGHSPQAGIYRIVALDAEGEQIDALRLEFRCYRVTDETES